MMPNSESVVSLSDQIACVDREIRMREKVYPRWVKSHKLTQKTADLELGRMRAVLGSLIRLYLSVWGNGMGASDGNLERVMAVGLTHMGSVRLDEMVKAAL